MVQVDKFIQQISSVVSNYGYDNCVPVPGRASRVWRFESMRLGIEVEFDTREQNLFILLVRMSGGNLPDGYYRDSLGAKCRIHLNLALETLMLPTKRYGRLSPDEQCNYLACGLDAFLRNVDFDNIDVLFV